VQHYLHGAAVGYSFAGVTADFFTVYEATEGTVTNDADSRVVTAVFPKIEHKLGEYTSDGNATCTEDGTETARCVGFVVCGHYDNRTEADSAHGHDWEAWTLSTTPIDDLASIAATRVCSHNPAHTDADSVTLADYIKSQTVEPVLLPIQIALGTMPAASLQAGSGWAELLVELHSGGKKSSP